MTEIARTGANRLARHARQLAKSMLRRLGLGSPGVSPYTPDFSDRRLAAHMGISLANDRRGPDAEQRLRVAFEGARKARALFGARFFVAPSEVLPLCKRLEALFPDAINGLLSRVEADAREGIPIYALQGPPLGASFPWSALPFGPGRDQMYPKRPHRFAFVPRNALASLFDAHTAARLDGMLDGWMRHAARGRDPLCYDSNLGVIQRLLALSWGWAFLAGRPEQESADGLALEWRVIKIIEADVRFLEPLLGRSAPNNHLLADRFAGWYLRTVFPELLDKPDLGDERRWCDELLAQTYPDGGSFEHSSHYHEFASEMGAAYLLLSSRYEHTPDSHVRERVRALLAYQCAMTGPEACPLPIGNAIEDALFPLDAGEAWCPGSLRELYRALFDPRLSPAPAEDETIVRAFWLLGGRLAPCQNEGTLIPLPTNFMQAGLHVMADDRLDARLIFRTGPAPGTALAAGHMHADLLAIYVNLQGRPLLVDAGTYSYRRHSSDAWGADDPHWRSYFAGPQAHNNLSIGNEDPLDRLTGDFRKRDVPSRIHVAHGTGGGLSFVEGIVQSTGPYDGLRRTCIHVEGEYWIILDSKPVASDPARPCWLGFQFAPSVVLKQSGHRISANFRDGTAMVFMTPCTTQRKPQLLFESTNPIGGWVSMRYGERQGAVQLRYPAFDESCAFSLLLSTDTRHRDVEFVRNQCLADGSWLIQLRSQNTEDWIVYQHAASTHGTFDAEGIAFDGRLLWIRIVDGRARALRWLGASRLKWRSLSICIQTQCETPCDLSLDEDSDPNDADQAFARFEWPTG